MNPRFTPDPQCTRPFATSPARPSRWANAPRELLEQLAEHSQFMLHAPGSLFGQTIRALQEACPLPRTQAEVDAAMRELVREGVRNGVRFGSGTGDLPHAYAAKLMELAAEVTR